MFRFATFSACWLVGSLLWMASAPVALAQEEDRWRSDRRDPRNSRDSRDSRDESGLRQGGPKMGGGGGGVALAVEGKYVFVVSGGTLYKIDRDSLKVLGSVQLGSRGMGERRGGRPDSRRPMEDRDRRDREEDWDRDRRREDGILGIGK